MRCNNCGWNNPDGLQRCQKCNQILESDPTPRVSSYQPQAPVQQQQHNREMTSTIRDIREFVDQASKVSNEAPQIDPRKATVRDFNAVSVDAGTKVEDKPATLTLVPADGAGQSISLDKSATFGKKDIDSENGSISDKQFSVMLENGRTLIKDISSLGNTYILAKADTEIKAGDILLIGNRRYVVA